ncbi:hypothetical protein HPB48_017478 [Haemaphysalis longicornis]|uniref:Uncharacterized protein n=1 Tax=Haemaphysalis longicornis TaxID=44386 RepID=A0A9J6FQ02_HAELO|nr:hypothetical protein HPB48_017478 [Haemaphysalis longicornis]
MRNPLIRWKSGIKADGARAVLLCSQETLSLVRNNLVTLHGEVPALPCLRSLNCRHNRLKNSGVPPQIFDLEDLSVVDLSYNDLREIPTDLEHARGLLVLNLAYNRIENIPPQLFVSLVDLIHLDLSGEPAG